MSFNKHSETFKRLDYFLRRNEGATPVRPDNTLCIVETVKCLSLELLLSEDPKDLNANAALGCRVYETGKCRTQLNFVNYSSAVEALNLIRDVQHLVGGNFENDKVQLGVRIPTQRRGYNEFVLNSLEDASSVTRLFDLKKLKVSFDPKYGEFSYRMNKGVTCFFLISENNYSPMFKFIRGYCDVLYDRTPLFEKYGDTIPSWILSPMLQTFSSLTDLELFNRQKECCLAPMAMLAHRIDPEFNVLPKYDFDPLFGGKLRRFLKARATFNNVKSMGLALSLQQVKRACDVVPEGFVLSSTLKHAIAISNSPEDIKPDIYEDYIEKLLFLWKGIENYKSDDLQEPSSSACFEENRTLALPIGEVGEPEPKGLRSYILNKVLDNRNTADTDTRQWTDLESYYYKTISMVHDRELLRMYETTPGEVQEFWGFSIPDTVPSMIQELKIQSDGEKGNARAVGIIEPLKVRMITAQSGIPTLISAPIQKSMHSFLKEFPAFRLIGNAHCNEELDRFYDRVLEHPELSLMCSGDYSAATDNLHWSLTLASHMAVKHHLGISNGSEKSAQEDLLDKNILRQTCYYNLGYQIDGITPLEGTNMLLLEKLLKLTDLETVPLEELCRVRYTGFPSLESLMIIKSNKDKEPYETLKKKASRIYSITQRNGQFMGSKLSFPHLCMINFISYWRTWQRYYKGTPKEFCSPNRLPVLVNGDDIVFCCNRDFYRLWQEEIRICGFTPSPGKNFVMNGEVIINSQWFHSRCFRYPRWKRLANPGLLSGQTKITGREVERQKTLCGVYNELILGFHNTTRAHNRFMSMNGEWVRKETHDGLYNLFIPLSLGGLGCLRPKGVPSYMSRYQKQVAHMLFQESLKFCRNKKIFENKSIIPVCQPKVLYWIPREGLVSVRKRVPYLSEGYGRLIKELECRLPPQFTKMFQSYRRKLEDPGQNLSIHSRDLSIQIDIEDFNLVLGSYNELSTLARAYKGIVTQNGEIEANRTNPLGVESRDCTGLIVSMNSPLSPLEREEL